MWDMRHICLFVWMSAACTGTTAAVEHVVLERDDERVWISGELVVEAQDGGLLILAPDGVLWAVHHHELVERKSDDAPFTPLDASQLSILLQSEMGDGFRVHETAHYIVCYNTTRQYARWCGALYERLYKAFHNYWSRRGLPLHEPNMPLVALVFRDQDSYARYAESEIGEATDSIVGFYSLRTNRVTMYDLTAVDAARRNRRPLSAAQINRLLAVERTVATIVHEATHQIAFNCGLHRRYADIPLWVSEGIAMYFETPDLSNSRGWRTVGRVNQVRLAEFRAWAPARPDDSLTTLISDDRRFHDPQQVNNAYPESWALSYYLIRNRPKQFLQYVAALSEKKPLIEDDASRRLKDFSTAFGDDLKGLDADFLRQIRRLR